MMLMSFLADDFRRNLLFSIVAVAITGISLVAFSGYGQTVIWAIMLATSAAITAFVMFLSFKRLIGESESAKFLVASQWLTLILFCIMSVIIDQALIDMQHRIDYNNCSMMLMIMAIIMTATNSISLVLYARPDLLGLGVAPARPSAGFEESVKSLVNNICAANNEPPRYDIAKKGASMPKFTLGLPKKKEEPGSMEVYQVPVDNPREPEDGPEEPKKPLIHLNWKGGKGGEGNERFRIDRPPRIRRPAEEGPRRVGRP